jgi:hypothetical protein
MPTTVPESVARHLSGAMQLAFERAATRYSDRLHESLYLFGGYPVRVRVVGNQMASQITRPFSHLKADRSDLGDPQLTIDLWDESETGIRGQVPSFNGGSKFRKMTAVYPDGGLIAQRLKNVLTCYNRSGRRIISSAVWQDELSVYERCKPLARALLEWHNDRNIQVVHASLVAGNGKGIIFAGKSGSGKSTAALACLSAGYQFLGEDFVGLQQLDDGSFIGHSLYNSVFLKISHTRRFPRFAPYLTKGLPHEEKCAVVLSQVFPDRLARVIPIRALVLPRIVETATPKFYLASKGETLLALAPSSLLQIPNRNLGVRGFDRLAQLVERVPCYWMELGHDLACIPQCVEEILAEVR